MPGELCRLMPFDVFEHCLGKLGDLAMMFILTASRNSTVESLYTEAHSVKCLEVFLVETQWVTRWAIPLECQEQSLELTRF